MDSPNQCEIETQQVQAELQEVQQTLDVVRDNQRDHAILLIVILIMTCFSS